MLVVLRRRCSIEARSRGAQDASPWHIGIDFVWSFCLLSNTKVGGARGMTVGEKKGKKKENQKQSTASHLQTAYRPGNANYRIQKASSVGGLASLLCHRTPRTAVH